MRTPLNAVRANCRPRGIRAPIMAATASMMDPEMMKREEIRTSGGNDSNAIRIPR